MINLGAVVIQSKFEGEIFYQAMNGISSCLNSNLLGRALEAEEALDVELCRLLEAGPVRVLGVHAVDAVLVDRHTALEALVPRLDAQRSVSQVLRLCQPSSNCCIKPDSKERK